MRAYEGPQEPSKGAPLETAGQLSPVGLRQAKAELSSLVDDVAAGAQVVISRRGRPLAALISASDLERFKELERRDDGLRAIFRGNGVRITPWTTPKILEVLTRLAGES